MAESFDPYYTWLGIPPKDQPPNHYRLLAIDLFEANADVIQNAADRQMAHLRTFQAGKHSAESQRLLNEVATAKVCLLRPDRKAAYDNQLRRNLAAETRADQGDVQSEAQEPAWGDLLGQTAGEAAPQGRVYPRAARKKGHKSGWRMAGGVAFSVLVVLLLVVLSLPKRGEPPAPRQAERPAAPKVERKEPQRPLAPVPSPTPNPPSSPTPPAEPPAPKRDFLKGPFAKLEVSTGGQFIPLQTDAAVETDDFYHWAEVPSEFAGLRFLRNKSQQGTTKFQVTNDGVVLMAIIGPRFSGRGGDWQREVVSQQDLERQGWALVGNLPSYYKENRSPQGWVVLTRECKAGETFSYRVEKYVAPVLLLK